MSQGFNKILTWVGMFPDISIHDSESRVRLVNTPISVGSVPENSESSPSNVLVVNGRERRGQGIKVTHDKGAKSADYGARSSHVRYLGEIVAGHAV